MKVNIREKTEDMPLMQTINVQASADVKDNTYADHNTIIHGSNLSLNLSEFDNDNDSASIDEIEAQQLYEWSQALVLNESDGSHDLDWIGKNVTLEYSNDHDSFSTSSRSPSHHPAKAASTKGAHADHAVYVPEHILADVPLSRTAQHATQVTPKKLLRSWKK